MPGGWGPLLRPLLLLALEMQVLHSGPNYWSENDKFMLERKFILINMNIFDLQVLVLVIVELKELLLVEQAEICQEVTTTITTTTTAEVVEAAAVEGVEKKQQ